MCQISRIGSVPWKEKYREHVIRLKDEVDLEAAKEIGRYLGFSVQSEEIRLLDLPKTIEYNYMVSLINARANQIRTYQKRNEKVPSFREFLEKRNKKKTKKS